MLFSKGIDFQAFISEDLTLRIQTPNSHGYLPTNYFHVNILSSSQTKHLVKCNKYPSLIPHNLPAKLAFLVDFQPLPSSLEIFFPFCCYCNNPRSGSSSFHLAIKNSTGLRASTFFLPLNYSARKIFLSHFFFLLLLTLQILFFFF